MMITNVKSLKKITEARGIIDQLQQQLLRTEQTLDDLVRASEIATTMNSWHLLDSFVTAARECLLTRLVVPEHQIDVNPELIVIDHDQSDSSTST